MKAFLIDPKEKTVSEVDYSGPYKEIYKFIEADCFSLSRLDQVNSIYVDDEGFFADDQYFFMVQGNPVPLAGKGLILGHDFEGETVASDLTLEDVRRIVEFPDKRLHYIGNTVIEGEIDHPVFGKCFQQQNIPNFVIEK